MFLGLSTDDIISSVCQSFSALCASSLQYVSAVSSSHSFSEAVLFLSLTLFRLISSKHCLHLLKFVLIPDHEISGITPEACCLLSINTLYTMTSYIKPQKSSFVKRFFRFFWNIIILPKELLTWRRFDVIISYVNFSLFFTSGEGRQMWRETALMIYVS